MNASMHHYFADYRFRLLASHFFLLCNGIDSPTSWLTPSGQRRKLRCPKSTTLSNSARSFPVLLCASRRLQGGLPSQTTPLCTHKDIWKKAPRLAERRTPLWSSRALEHSAERSERVSEPQAPSSGKVSRSLRRMRSAQGIGWSAAQTDCGTGPAFFGYFLCRSKESNSPAGENITSEYLKTEQLIRHQP